LVDRKLTTILAADVTGYSRMMEQDEAATLATLRDYRAAMAGFIARHRGRVVNTAGDSLLAEFASVVEAVQCAVEIQRELAARNRALPPARQMQFRIGLNLGDVMVEGDDLFGEGVNIAARLQQLAEPGGICIAGAVFEQVRNKLTIGFDFLGEQSVKNIAEPLPVYRIDLSGTGRPPPPSPRPSAGPDRPKRRRLRRAAGTAGLLILTLLAINLLADPRELWFQWPTLAILFLFGLRAVRLLDRPGGGPPGS
jgi:adenylate cyclase